MRSTRRRGPSVQRRRCRSAAPIAACVAVLTLACVWAPAHAATILEARPASVAPCPLPTPGEPPLTPTGEPVFCEQPAPTEPNRAHGGRRASTRRPPKVDDEALGRDPFKTLGGNSPLCHGGRIPATASRNCRMSGSLAHPYAIGSYNFDYHINTGVTRIKSNLAEAVQTLASYFWLGLLYLVKGVLLLLEWAFSLNLLGESLRDVRGALIRLHQRVLGEPWFLTAIAIAGIWGIWRGLIQRRTIETLSGLAATVALMVVALVLITNPIDTIGRATRLTNDASLAMLSGASTGTVDDGDAALADSFGRIFDTIVLRPWCALEFGDIEFCLGRPPHDVPDDLRDEAREARSVADLFLRFRANAGSRFHLYKQWRDDDHPLSPKVRMQKEGSTPTRMAMLALIAIGVLGAIALLAWLGLKLISNGILALILLLFAPAMFLAPAFGESGRAAFISWGKRLLAAIVAKAIYALLLAVVLVAAGVLARLNSLGFFAVWLLQISFWWGLFLKRDEIVGWLTVANLPTRQRFEGGATRMYHNLRLAQWGLGAISRRAGGAVATPARTLAGYGLDRREGRRKGVELAAGDDLKRRADLALGTGLEAARSTLERNDELERELRDANRGLGKYDTNVQAAKQMGQSMPTPTEREAALLGRRDILEASRQTPKTVRQARNIVAKADRNLALSGREFTDADRDALVDQRRRDIEEDLPVDHERNLRFAGIDPREYARSGPEERVHMEEQVRDAIERDRNLLGAVPAAQRPAPRREAAQRARSEVDSEQARERVREQHEIRRRERRRRRVRAYVYRRR
jgi:hypothetical protein